MLSYPGLGAALGVLPPPHSLCSVPLMTTPPAGIMDATAVSRPTPHTAVSWFNPLIPAVPTVQGAPATASAEVPSTSASLLPGVSLSPATEPFPRKLVEKIQAGQFVEMKELLSDNIALLQQLDVFQGQCAMPVLPGALKPRLREVATLPSWLYSYLAYVALRSPDPATRDRLAYGRLLLREAQRHGGAGWLDYDRVFRQQAALDATLPWNAIHPAIQAATLTSRTAQPGLFCTLCREPDHTARDCALAYLERPPSHPRRRKGSAHHLGGQTLYAALGMPAGVTSPEPATIATFALVVACLTWHGTAPGQGRQRTTIVPLLRAATQHQGLNHLHVAAYASTDTGSCMHTPTFLILH